MLINNCGQTEATPKPEGGNPFKKSVVQEPVYHGTSYYFDKFKHTSDIGYHFGTESAAHQRVRDNRRGIPEVSVDFIEPSEMDVDSFMAEKNTNKGNRKSQLYYLLLKKLDNPSVRLRDTIRKMDDSDVEATIVEYSGKPDSKYYADRIKKYQDGKYYNVKVDGDVVFSTKDHAEAKQKAKELSNEVARPKSVYINVKNPIELPDLGVWPAHEIAEKSGFSKAELQRVYDADKADKYSVVKDILKSKGYDAIKYVNEMEDKGSTSYIVFDNDQISSFNQSRPSEKGGLVASSTKNDSSRPIITNASAGPCRNPFVNMVHARR